MTMYKNNIYKGNIEIDQKMWTIKICGVYLVAGNNEEFNKLVGNIENVGEKVGENEVCELYDLPF